MSFLNQMVMADQLYQQQQKEREDREFELLKRKHEQEEMERKAYLAPFETKETLAQYEDAANERQGKKNQQLAWMSPYRPSVEVADDGTRKVGAEMPTSLVLENLMAAAGPGFQSDYITPFTKAAPDAIGKATLDVKETPEEAKSRVEAETEHKRALELAGARKAAPRASSPKAPAQSAQEKQYIELVKKAYVQNEQEFQANHKRRPNEAEIKDLSERAVAAARVQMEAMQMNPAATAPATKPSPQPAPIPAPTSDPIKDLDALIQPPEPQTVQLKDKQAAGPVTVPQPAGTQLNFDQNPEIAAMQREKASLERELVNAQADKGLDAYVKIRILQQRLADITSRLDAKQKQETMSLILGNQNPGTAPWLK